MKHVNKKVLHWKNDWDSFKDVWVDSGILHNEKVFERIKEYSILLSEWIPYVNLISKKDSDRFLKRHILESAMVSLLPEFSGKGRLLDFGTGAGFPGMILKLVYPELKTVLIDSIRKKVLFLEKCIEKLYLKDITVYCDRIDNIQDTEFGEYDLITSRAVGPVNEIVNATGRFLEKGDECRIILPRGPDYLKEIKEFSVNNWNIYLQTINIKRYKTIPFAIVEREKQNDGR